jgi:LVIVD repeat-containing protein
MRGRGLRLGCAAVMAFTAVVLLPSSAGAHCLDDTGLVQTLEAELYSSWSKNGDSCASQGTPGVQTTASARDLTVAPPAAPATGSFTQVGHNPLMRRGMNAAIAVQGNYAYIGSRTDGGHDGPTGGIMVVDISNPAQPDLLGRPFDVHPGESSRELRVWRSQHLLIVLNTNCGFGPNLHLCTEASISNIRFYDISGSHAAAPRLIREFKVDTHEFFLWQDPANPQRALIFAGNAGATCGIRGGAPSCPFSVWDISGVPDGGEPVTLFSGLHGYSQGGLHSLTISNDGTRAYFALLPGGFAIVDTSDFAEGKPFPAPRPITPDANRPTW